MISIRKPPTFKLVFKEHNLIIVKAVNPFNINWRLFGLTFRKKQFIRLIFLLISFTILFFSFLQINNVYDYRQRYIKDNGKKGKLVFLYALSITIIIMFFNWVLNQFIFYTTPFEFHEKLTSEYSSQIKKLVTKFLLNSSILLILLCFQNQ